MRKTDSENIKILNFDAQYADDVLDIQTECGLSVWSKTDYLGELERDDSIFKIVRTAGDKIVGFALVRLTIGNSNPANTSFDSSEILNIAVRNSFQHKGIGQMIFDKIRRELERKNIAEIWLEVRQSNSKAINFYQKNNFEKQFERKNYYANPTENALVLRCLIEDASHNRLHTEFQNK